MSTSTGARARAAHLSIGEVLGVAARGVPRHHDLEDPLPREPGPHRPRAHAVGLPEVLRRPTSTRLRWILHQQKEHFLPLKVIKERLDELDDGETGALPEADGAGRAERRRTGPTPSRGRGGPGAEARAEKPRRRARDQRAELPLVDLDGDADPEPEPEPAAPPTARRDGRRDAPDEAEDAPGATSASPAPSWHAPPGSTDGQLGELEAYGLLTPAARLAASAALFDDDALAIARGRGRLRAARHRAASPPDVPHFAEREAALFEQVLLPLLRQRNPRRGRRRRTSSASWPRLGRQLRTALLRADRARARSPSDARRAGAATTDPARRRTRSREHVAALGRRDRRRPPRRRRARRRAEGRADLPRRPRPRDPRRRRGGRLHRDLPLRARLRPGAHPPGPRARHRRPRRRDGRGHRRHRPHARVPAAPARGARPATVDVCTLLDRPARRIVPLDVRYVGAELDDVFVLGYGLHRADLYRNLPFVVDRRPGASCRSDPRPTWRSSTADDAGSAGRSAGRPGGRVGHRPDRRRCVIRCRSSECEWRSRRISRSCSSARTTASATCRSSSARPRPPRSSTRCRAWRRPGR